MDETTDHESTEDYMLEPQAAHIVISHPGITMKQFLAEFRPGYLPHTFRIIVQDVDADIADLELIVKLWNELNDFQPNDFDDLVAMYKLCCGLMLLPSSIEMTHLKMSVIHKVFRQTSRCWEIHPVRIHAISKDLCPMLANSRNLMYFVRIIASVSQMAFNISCSLVWSLFFRCLGHQVKMYRVHSLEEMLHALKDFDCQKMKDNMSELYSLLDSIVFLINVIVFRKSQDMISERFSSYFETSREQVKELLQWIQNLQRMFPLRSNTENEDSILISELLEFDIEDRLRDILKDPEDAIYP